MSESIKSKLDKFIDRDGAPLTNCAANPVYDAEGNKTGTQRIDFEGPPPFSPPGADGIPDISWVVTVPRISCPGNNVGTCETVTGALTIRVVWVLGNDQGWVDQAPDPDEPIDGKMVDTDGDGIDDTYIYTPNYIVPDHMDDWPSEEEKANPEWYTSAKLRWTSFVNHFGLKNVNGQPAPFAQKSIYFHPVCEQRDLAGVSGGQNYGVLARIPVIVD